MTIQAKLEALKGGKHVITNDAEMDAMLAWDSDTMKLVRSKPNPNRLGLRDQYIAWISELEAPDDGPDYYDFPASWQNGKI